MCESFGICVSAWLTDLCSVAVCLQRNSLGNLESTLCAIDAMDFSSAESTEQYKRKSLLRELNKAFTGFQQRSLQPAAAPSTEDEEEEMEGERKMRAKSEEYFSADDGTPLEGQARTGSACHFTVI